MRIGTIVVSVSALCLQTSAAVSDFTRTVVSTKLNGWEGVQFIKWEKGSGSSAGRGWAVKFDLSKGYRLRTQLGDASGNKATVGTMAECVADVEGVAPIMGMNADYFDTGSTIARPTGLVITDDALVSAGWPYSSAPEMCYIMQTADGNLVHSKLLRNAALPSGYPSASWQVTAPNGRKIRQAVRTNYCNYPVKGGKINPVGGSSGGTTFPTTIGNYQNRSNYPRPLIGIGTNEVGVATNLVLFINDGRQSGWSINFPDVDAYQIMIDEGCNEVGEFDGGGSAAMWMAFGANSEYNFGTSYKTAHGNYVNKPSDGSPRKDACGIFVLPPKKVNYTVEVNDGNLYADMDGAFKAVAPGDTVKVKANTVFASGTFPRNCTITAADSTKVECAALSVPSGVRVLFRDVAFEKGGTASPLTVAAGGTAAVAGGVGVAKIVTADASGFEIAESLTADLVVDCAAAGAAGQTFGKSSLSVEQIESSLSHIRHPLNRSMVAKAIEGANGTELVWKVAMFAACSDGEGFNYTNRTVSVTVDSIGDDFSDGTKLRFTVRDLSGVVVATVDRNFKGVGVYSFDTAESAASSISPGRNYTYAVTVVDAAGRELANVDPAKGTFRTAADANWFATLAKDDSEVGGQWAVKPKIEDNIFLITNGVTYSFKPTVAQNGIVQVTEESCFDNVYSTLMLEDLRRGYETNPPQGMFTLKERDDESLVWVGLVRENGHLAYRELFGVPPETGRFYMCRQEIDYSKGGPRVSYLVANSSDDFVRLADADGEVWFDGPDAHGYQVSSVELEGTARVKGLIGKYADKSLIHVDGKDIVLMTNVILDPTQLTPGEYAVSQEGHAFRWTDNGRSAAYDETTGAFKVLASAPKNGYESYVSYVLNMDPEDPDSKPIARFVRDETTGKTKIDLVLANGKPFEPRSQEQTGFTVKVALESSDTVGFASSQTGEKHLPEDFGPEIDTTEAPKQFFRCRIFLEK